jgi:hypothetical protein
MFPHSLLKIVSASANLPASVDEGVPVNLVDAIWSGRPAVPREEVKVHPLHLSGESVEDKLRKCRELMAREHAHVLVVSALDEIACKNAERLP